MSESKERVVKLIEKCKSNGMPPKKQETFLCMLRTVQISMRVSLQSSSSRESSKQELRSALSLLGVISKTIDV
jgi:hypothetical protein